MNWTQYKKKIILKAKELNLSDEYLTDYISYVKPLFEQDLPVITSSSHFSALVGYDHDYICRMAFSSKHFYRSFAIKKANGNNREIDEPLPDLKQIQFWILQEILYRIPVSPYAKAYVKGRSIKHNARFHRNQSVVLTVDVKDFFPSIGISDIFQIFINIGYKKNIALFLANLCCLDGKLPQGAPTSPYLSNIRMIGIDEEIAAYCKLNLWRFTRYSDDLTFSGNSDVHKLLNEISKIIYKNGFSLNSSKTRIARKNTRQEVTGIVVNSHMQLPKKVRKEIRQQVYYIRKYGLDSHLEHIGETRKNYLSHLLGKACFALFINPNDIELKKSSMYLKELVKKMESD